MLQRLDRSFVYVTRVNNTVENQFPNVRAVLLRVHVTKARSVGESHVVQFVVTGDRAEQVQVTNSVPGSQVLHDIFLGSLTQVEELSSVAEAVVRVTLRTVVQVFFRCVAVHSERVGLTVLVDLLVGRAL